MMRSRSRQLWLTVIGLIAMMSAVFAVPATTLAAVSKAMPAAVSSQTTAHMTASNGAHDGMPCQKPCPHCPKPCSDTASCMLKCFQSQAPLPVGSTFDRIDGRVVVWPAQTAVLSGTMIPPLLRPPSA